MTDEQEKIAVHIIVHGFVQGVGFRYFTQQNASRLGIVGWVRNQYNGNVEIWAESSRDTLEQFVKAVRRGPGRASVDRLDTHWSKPKGDYRGFQIRY